MPGAAIVQDQPFLSGLVTTDVGVKIHWGFGVFSDVDPLSTVCYALEPHITGMLVVWVLRNVNETSAAVLPLRSPEDVAIISYNEISGLFLN